MVEELAAMRPPHAYPVRPEPRYRVSTRTLWRVVYAGLTVMVGGMIVALLMAGLEPTAYAYVLAGTLLGVVVGLALREDRL